MCTEGEVLFVAITESVSEPIPCPVLNCFPEILSALSHCTVGLLLFTKDSLMPYAVFECCFKRSRETILLSFIIHVFVSFEK